MTNAGGASFLSYRRSRLDEARLIIAAQREHGIPTWQDVNDLAHEPTEQELERVLEQDTIAGAVLWITPDMPESSIIRKVEIPSIIRRHRRGDGFFLVPVAAGGLSYPEAAAAAASELTADDLSTWNMHRCPDRIEESDAVEVAKRVLRQKLIALHRSLPAGQALRLGLFTRVAPSKQGEGHLLLDWSHRFTDRLASQVDWEKRLLPALSFVTQEIRKLAPGRHVEAYGQLALPAAVALGAAFSTTSGLQLGWLQETVAKPTLLWQLNGTKDTPITAQARALHADGEELAVLVSITGNAEPAFVASQAGLPKFRAIVCAQTEKVTPHLIQSSEEATDIALKVNTAIRAARDKFGKCNAIHLFMAAPAGFAVLLGRLLNSLGPIQLYEHIPHDTVGRYLPVARLNPSF